MDFTRMSKDVKGLLLRMFNRIPQESKGLKQVRPMISKDFTKIPQDFKGFLSVQMISMAFLRVLKALYPQIISRDFTEMPKDFNGFECVP